MTTPVQTGEGDSATATSSNGTARLELPDSAAAVRIGRRFLVTRAHAVGASDLTDDAALVASELVANAMQHGKPPITLTVHATADEITVEVHDTGREALIRPVPSSGNMTGRGLLLVEQLGAQWGVRRDGSGKTVWCTLTAAHQTARRPSGAEPLDVWDDGHDVATDERRFAVTLGDVPTGLLVTAKAHMDNLVREFTLASSGNVKDGVAVPDDLARLIMTVVHGFADARTAIKRQATAAAHRGERRTSITLHLPLSAAEAGEAYLAALDEADRYARAARLLTLAAPPRPPAVPALVRACRDRSAAPGPPAVSRSQRSLPSRRSCSPRYVGWPLPPAAGSAWSGCNT